MPDSSLWQVWVAIGAAFTTMGTGFIYLLGQISRRDDDSNKLKDTLVAYDREGLLRFATKEDLDRLETRITQTMRDMMREHEMNIRSEMDRRFQIVGRS